MSSRNISDAQQDQQQCGDKRPCRHERSGAAALCAVETGADRNVAMKALRAYLSVGVGAEPAQEPR